MAGSAADYLENKIADYVFGKTAFTPATPLYVGLSTTTINDAGGNITEPGNGYAEVSIANNKTTFGNASGGVVSNAIAITFPEASGAWGSCTDWFITDENAAGNIYAFGVLTSARSPVAGDVPRFAVGALVITVT